MRETCDLSALAVGLRENGGGVELTKYSSSMLSSRPSLAFSHPRTLDRNGQYTIEWAVLVTAMVIAGTLMLSYIRDALRANVKLTEIQLNGAMRDNRPVQ